MTDTPKEEEIFDKEAFLEYVKKMESKEFGPNETMPELCSFGFVISNADEELALIVLGFLRTQGYDVKGWCGHGWGEAPGSSDE